MRNVLNLSATFTRPADTTAYTAGDLVANSVTAASVAPLSWAAAPVMSGGAHYGYFRVVGVRMHKSKSDVTNAQFRVHLYSASPVVATTGDNAAYGTDVANNADWLGSLDGTHVAKHSDGTSVVCVPAGVAAAPIRLASGGTIYGLVEALAGYTPASAEVFTFELLVEQDY